MELLNSIIPGEEKDRGHPLTLEKAPIKTGKVVEM
jgi:hypothetical protein